MSIFKGAGVALVTPFKEDNSVDYDALEKLLNYQLSGQTDAIIVCGTTGEPPTMTEEERLAVIDFTLKHVERRVPVIAGTGSNSTQSAIDFSMKAQELGVDGLLVVTPYYNKATQKGLYEHYGAIAKAVSLPIIMYNVPSRTGCNLMPATAARLADDFENIVAIKEASGDISQVASLANLVRGKLDIYSGNDDQVIPLLSLGGIGVISVLSNIAPKATHDIVMEYLEGDKDKSLEIFLEYLDLMNVLFVEVNPIPVKAALALMGLCSGKLRLPLTDIEPSNKALVEAQLKKVGLI